MDGERKSERERREKKRKPVTGYTETMAFNNRSYKRFWWSTAEERAKRSGPTSAATAAGNRYPPCNYRLSLRLVSLSFCVCVCVCVCVCLSLERLCRENIIPPSPAGGWTTTRSRPPIAVRFT